MSKTDPFDPALAALLDADRPPPLPADFAERLVEAAQSRRDSLPRLRKSAAQRWRSGRRIALGVLAGGLLSSAAAATGVLEQVGITLPEPVQAFVDDVARSVTRTVTGSEQPPRPVVTSAAAPPAAPAPVRIEGPIDSREELEEVFTRAEARREERTVLRRERVDDRIDQAIERRRSEGLPVPTAEEEAALRQRLEDARARRDAVVGDRREAMRDDLRERVDEGEAIAPRDLLPRGGERLERLTPEQREALRQRLRDRRAAATGTDATDEISP